MSEHPKRPSPAGVPGPRSAAMDELRRRLTRFGVTTGREFAPRPRHHPQPIEALVEGAIHETPHGPSFRAVRTYPPGALHGSLPLVDWLSQVPTTLARLGADNALAYPDLRRFIFLDTETTGLGAGTGTFAFLVGIGFFADDGAFEVHQFFIRDPAEERAMLTILHDLLARDGALVTFNGRSFDVPLLADRYIMSRMPPHISTLLNLDLLHPARRLWKRRLASCRLSALEADILSLRRASADVPGHLIPFLYREYLRTGDAREMTRVLYHNEQDILSMVSLGVVLCRAFEQPYDPALPADDRLSLARWYQQCGMLAECEAAYRAALDDDSDGATRYEILHGLAALLKRAGRAEEAVPLWEYLADLKLDTSGHEELAKYYEWQAGDLSQALAWTESGLVLAGSWLPGLRRTEALRNLEHRRARLLRKTASGRDENPTEAIH